MEKESRRRLETKIEHTAGGGRGRCTCTSVGVYVCVCVCVYVYVWERQEKIRSATIPRVTSSTYFQVNDNYYPGRTCAAVCPAAVPADNCIIYMAVGGSGRFLLLGNARDFSSFPWREDADAIVRNAHCKGNAMDQETEREREREREREG